MVPSKGAKCRSASAGKNGVNPEPPNKKARTDEANTTTPTQRRSSQLSEEESESRASAAEDNLDVALRAAPTAHAGGSVSDMMHATAHILDSPAKTIVDTLVRSLIFPKIKFLKRNDIQLEYSEEPKSICNMILESIHVGPETNKRVFWNDQVKRWVLIRLAAIRNDVTAQIKKHFWCK